MRTAELTRTIDEARAAQEGWSGLTGPARSAVLGKVGDALRRRAAEIAPAIVEEVGKPVLEAEAEVVHAAAAFDYFAGQGFDYGETVVPSRRPGVQLSTRRQPVGLIAVITPWNFPIHLATVKIAPSLAIGNGVVFKPASRSSRCGGLLVECLLEAGVPEGLVGIAEGPGSVVGDALIGDSRIKGVSFTGSTEVGMEVQRRAAERGIRCLCEMGGKNGAVVLDDADLDLALAAIVDGAFRYAGQKCTATSRVIAQAGIHDRLVAGLIDRVGQLTVGDPADPENFVGPVIDEETVDKALSAVESAVAAGARLAAGGRRAEVGGGDAGRYLLPTVVTGVDPGHAIAQEELFAPVVAVTECDDLEAAIRILNDTPYGLTSSVFTESLEAGFRFAEAADTGAVQVNLPTTGAEYSAPFGGRAASGSGHRELGRSSLDFYGDLKTVAIRHGAAGGRG